MAERLLGYTRVSTSSQHHQLQIDALIEAGVERRDIFADTTSGRRAAITRPGMEALLAYAQTGDTVVVWRIDRLGRSLLDVINTAAHLRERKIGIRSLQDGIDPETPTGRMMLNLMATLAEYERELITERVCAGVAAAKANGTTFGRPPADADVVAMKLAIANEHRARGLSAAAAAELVGWSRATLYRHQGQRSQTDPSSGVSS